MRRTTKSCPAACTPPASSTSSRAASGRKQTQEDKIRASVDLYLRKAWTTAVHAHLLIRRVLLEQDAGNIRPFATNKRFFVEMSKLMDLTIHTQAPGNEAITMLDITLSESIARGVSLAQVMASKVAIPSPVGKPTNRQLRDMMVAQAAAGYGNLLRDAARDKRLLDWFVAHYQKVPSA